jgi:hypothetical protein
MMSDSEGERNYFYNACKNGSKGVVKTMIYVDRRRPTKVLDLSQGLCAACEGSHLKVVKLLIAEAAKDNIKLDFDLGLDGAIEGLVNNMISKQTLNDAQEIIKLMIDNGADKSILPVII